MNKEESIQQIETLIEAWQLDEADLNQTDINAMQSLLKENQELKLELSGYRQAILNDKEMLGLKEENDKLKSQLKGTTHCFDEEEHEKLKKQVEERTKMYQNTYNYSQKMEGKAIILETQQKEFINYLENEKDRLTRECSQIYEDSLGKTRLVNEDIFNELDTILSKYIEIIGGKDENN